MNEVITLEDASTFLVRDYELFEPLLIERCKIDRVFTCGTVASLKLLKVHLSTLEVVSTLDNINSAICRCVEKGYKEQLVLLLENLDKLMSMCVYEDGCEDLNTNLMLRSLNVDCYLIAKDHGFKDVELEKRIVLIQRTLRKQEVDKFRYEGPIPEKYITSFITYYNENDIGASRYWGYRHSMYYFRWNRKQRYRLLRMIPSQDCRLDAWIDHVEPCMRNEVIVWVGEKTKAYLESVID